MSTLYRAENCQRCNLTENSMQLSVLQAPLPRTIWGRGALAWDGSGEGGAEANAAVAAAGAPGGRLVAGGGGTPSAGQVAKL